MATERQKEGSSPREGTGNAASLSLIEHIKRLVESEYLEPKEYLTFDELLFKLRRWWCKHYNRPYKDPLLDSYTFEELFYEYWDVTYTPPRPDEAKDPQEIPQEEYDWAAEEEAKELLELERQQQVVPEPENDSIVEETDVPSDDEWAAKHLANNKLNNPSPEEVNDGGDISASFEA